MCGFAGFCNIEKQNFVVDEGLLQAMQKKIAHRGPDGYGIWKSDQHQIGLAHRRLSIIDLSHAGKQPMIDRDETVVVSFNGEIYNHQELRASLESRGYEYFSHTDTETLLYAYKEWGIDFIHKLDGMFAFVLFDLRSSELFFVRDRIGVKPLYFSLQNGVISFASEIKALWELPWNKKTISQQALYHYLTFMVAPAPYTIFEKVYKLPAGFYAKIDASKKITFNEWYSPLKELSYSDKKNMSDERFCREQIRDMLVQATKKRMMSDVPFGAFLSGGVDSSLNVALMANSIGKVKTFTVAFSDGPESNELKWARRVSDHFDTDHHELIISEKEAFEFYEKMVCHLDEPLADCVCVPFYHVAKLARDAGVKVVQVGEGADELFFGYSVYARYQKFYNTFWRPGQKVLPRFLRTGISKAAQWAIPNKSGILEILRNWSENRSLLWGGAIAFNEFQKQLLLQKNNNNQLGADSIIDKVFSGMRQEFDSFSIVDYHLTKIQSSGYEYDFFKKLVYLELKQRLPELLLMRTDKMSMATSLEARVPFLDHKLVEFMLQVPSALLYKDNTTKYLLKKVAEEFLPHDVIYRKKVGFAAPTVRWFDQGKFFPDYFKQMSIHSKNAKFLPKQLFKLSTSPSVLAVQKWVLQNFWALS